MSSILKAKEEFDGAVEKYKASKRDFESFFAFRPKEVTKTHVLVSELYEAYRNMKEKEERHNVAKAEYAYEVERESTRVKACAEVREEYKAAEKAVEDAVAVLLEASRKLQGAKLEYTPVLDAPVRDPDQYVFAKDKLNEAVEKHAIAEMQFDMAMEALCKARRKYSALWESLR